MKKLSDESEVLDYPTSNYILDIARLVLGSHISSLYENLVSIATLFFLKKKRKEKKERKK